MDIENYLKKNNLFSGLNSFQLARLAGVAVIKKVNKGEIIFLEGEPALGFFIVIEGKIKIYKLSAEGKEYILHIASNNDTIAEVTVFSGKDYPASTEAVENSSLLFFPKTGFLDVVREYPEVGMRILGAVAGRQRKFADIIEDLSLRDVLSRLSKYILNLSKEKGKDTFELDIQKSELALKLGTIPETLSRNLKKLKTKKIISLEDKTVTILNKDALQKLSGSAV